eukprot:gnl/Dysnectes_brevis/6169_a9349_327.p1 GENE.gnl/Dysnectes_brevis/6169_a9349_327~~gnl/Dysnectes_brevis/6169_a9349_327.p1  ORF type:complete len:633 (+),score=69.49 gnl/Dysnectes_brevis/6169_a9349_327:134-2032(+)
MSDNPARVRLPLFWNFDSITPLDVIPNDYSDNRTDNIICSLCEGLAASPIQMHPCKHLMCLRCQLQRDQKGIKKAFTHCPVCEIELQPISRIDGHIMESLVLTRTRCPFYERGGCEAEPRLASLKEHLEECRKAAVLCKCGHAVVRERLKHHHKTECDCRIVRCKYCDESLQFSLYEEHLSIAHQVCSVKDGGCGDRYVFKDAEHHLPASCPFCGDEVRPCCLLTHFEGKHHLQEMCTRIVELQQESKGFKEKLQDEHRLRSQLETKLEAVVARLSSQEALHRKDMTGLQQSISTLTRALDGKLSVSGGVISGALSVQGPLTSPPHPLDSRMYCKPIAQYDVRRAMAEGVARKLGTGPCDGPVHWDGYERVRFGGNADKKGNGLEVSVPSGATVLWLRIPGVCLDMLNVYYLDGDKRDLGAWGGGWRSSNCYSPDGSLADGTTQGEVHHQWLPIALPRAGPSRVGVTKTAGNGDGFWCSGVAFGTNPWSHATHSAYCYLKKANGDTGTINPHDNWHHDVLSVIAHSQTVSLKVPVVSNGQDRVLFLIEHNNDWNGCQHSAITVNGHPIDRFRATFSNPFSRHWSSKFYFRYIATTIPAAIIPRDAIRLDVSITAVRGANIYFRELGTHAVCL